MNPVLRNLSNLLLLVLFSILGACTLVPGAHISGSGLFGQSDIEGQAQVLPITPALINKMQSNRAMVEAKTNEQLQKLSSQYSYRVGIGDVLNITVWDHPELTIPAGQFRSAGETGNVVHPDGTIFYPYVGKVQVAGKHVTEIRELIAKDLGRFIEAPQIDVSVAAYRSQRVFVSGAVTQPSTVPITNVPLTLLDALNACGGMSADADWRSVVLTSKTEQGTSKEVLDLYALYQKGDMSQNRLLAANDIIHIPRNDGLKVFVMGDVIKAETQRMDRSGLTLAEALNNVGGINEATANASGIFVLRANEAQDKLVDVYQLDASLGSMLILSTQFQLQPMDIVYVTSAPMARWNKVIEQLVPSFTSIYQLDRVGNE
jgi:polysaccharide export outer membrane protein